MKEQFSLAHLTALQCSPPELTYVAARAGYDYVSIRPIYMGIGEEPNYDLANKKEMFRETKRALQETGLNVLDIELAKIADGINPTLYEPAFEVAAELGAKHVLSSIWTEDRSFAIESFASLCDLASEYNLTVELEFVPIASVANLNDTIDILRTVNKSNAGLMIDAHHFHRSGDVIEDLKKVPAEWFRYFHLCDAVEKIPRSKERMTEILREERLYVGEGGLPLIELVNQIPTVPYSLEIPHLKRVDELGVEEHARRCLQSAKTFMEQRKQSI